MLAICLPESTAITSETFSTTKVAVNGAVLIGFTSCPPCPKLRASAINKTPRLIRQTREEIPMTWIQRPLVLRAQRRGLHLVTADIVANLNELAEMRAGILHVFIQHTSASLTINENADPDVQVDMESSLNAIVPEDFPYIHTLEGPDDMPAHVKSSLMGSSVTVPVTDGRLALGTWQGIYLCEHRDHASGRHLVLTLWGES